MPSIFTISGPDLGRAHGRRSRKKKNCKRVRTGKRGCTIELCFVGKSRRVRSGWSFMKGTKLCSR